MSTLPESPFLKNARAIHLGHTANRISSRGHTPTRLVEARDDADFVGMPPSAARPRPPLPPTHKMRAPHGPGWHPDPPRVGNIPQCGDCDCALFEFAAQNACDRHRARNGKPPVDVECSCFPIGTDTCYARCTCGTGVAERYYGCPG